MEYFSSKEAAKRYFLGRPDFHSEAINRISTFLQLGIKLSMALDIACGTGLSSKALLAIADEVYATDISGEMLEWAHEKDRINYCLAAAEKQPLPDNEFDLVTVSSGVHWFNIDEFLKEANRLLKPGAWLVLYENYFTGKMKGNDSFKGWVDGNYLLKFPSPPRNKNYDWSPENLKAKNFTIQIADEFENEISFNRKQLISYFTTQSNIIAVVEAGAFRYTEAEQWLERELWPYFENAEEMHTFLFGNRIKYLQKQQ